jgi:hypothetical protein
MATERFSKEQFEASLPRNKEGHNLWRYVGFRDGEHCYSIPIHHPKFPEREPDVEIFIRSSVDNSGFAADTASDSIRVTLVDAFNYKPLATKESKPQRWVARTRNWRENLTELIRWSFKVGCLLGACPACKRGDAWLRRVSNPNKQSCGALYVSCNFCSRYFLWINEETGEPCDGAMPKRKKEKRKREDSRTQDHTRENRTAIR